MTKKPAVEMAGLSLTTSTTPLPSQAGQVVLRPQVTHGFALSVMFPREAKKSIPILATKIENGPSPSPYFH